MGKIFGISDLPVSTIMSPFEHVKFKKQYPTKILSSQNQADRFISSNNKNSVSTNGIGKLIAHFGKIKK